MSGGGVYDGGDGVGDGVELGVGVDGVDVGVDVGVELGAVVGGMTTSDTSGSAVICCGAATCVSMSASVLTTLATGTDSPLILASLVSNTRMFVPAFAEVPANLTPSTK